MFRRSLVGRFAVGSLAVFVLTGGTVSAMMIHDVRAEAEAQAVSHAPFATEDTLAPALTRVDLTAPIEAICAAPLPR